MKNVFFVVVVARNIKEDTFECVMKFVSSADTVCGDETSQIYLYSDAHEYMTALKSYLLHF